MKHIDHIGIAVKQLAFSIPLFEKLLNTTCYKTETVTGENVVTAFLKTGETKIELLQDEKENGVINKFIEKRGEGVHHIAFEVENIQQEITRLKEAGFAPLNEEPKRGADNKMICFLHPKSTNGILIELCESVNAGEPG
jgi:methylmalonyl-CoA/ethylmalonyl-CoA epimerase